MPLSRSEPGRIPLETELDGLTLIGAILLVAVTVMESFHPYVDIRADTEQRRRGRTLAAENLHFAGRGWIQENL